MPQPDHEPGERRAVGACSRDRTRLYCPLMAGRELGVCDGLIRFGKEGFVIGVVERPRGKPVHPPASISAEQRQILEQLYGLTELSSDEARRVPLRNENQRRREAFEARVRRAIEAACQRHGRWPSIREVQAVLVQFGFPAGRKEKIGGYLRSLKRSQETQPVGRETRRGNGAGPTMSDE